MMGAVHAATLSPPAKPVSQHVVRRNVGNTKNSGVLYATTTANHQPTPTISPLRKKIIMGNRSNLIVITDRVQIEHVINNTPLWDRDQEIAPDKQLLPHSLDLVTGVVMYSHWGGMNAVLDALHACCEYGLNRITHESYFVRILARAFTAGDDEETGSGIKPVSFVVAHDAPLFTNDEQVKPVLTDSNYPKFPVIDLTTREIYLYESNFFGEGEGSRGEVYPLDGNGLCAIARQLTQMVQGMMQD